MPTSEQLSISELMQKYGYTRSYVCHCDGYETHVYNKDNYELRWRKFKHVFRINQGSLLLKAWAPIKQLTEALKNIHDVAVQK
jgi:hypothetical protein